MAESAYPARTRHVGRPRGAHTERVLRGSKCAAFFPSPCFGFLPFIEKMWHRENGPQGKCGTVRKESELTIEARETEKMRVHQIMENFYPEQAFDHDDHNKRFM